MLRSQALQCLNARVINPTCPAKFLASQTHVAFGAALLQELCRHGSPPEHMERLLLCIMLQEHVQVGANALHAAVPLTLVVAQPALILQVGEQGLRDDLTNFHVPNALQQDLLTVQSLASLDVVLPLNEATSPAHLAARALVSQTREPEMHA